MVENPDFKELLQLLNAAGVEYLLVGGYAVMEYSEPHYTKDLDVWVGDAAQNSVKLLDALAKFGAPLERDAITADTFAERDVVYQIGIAPNRIDIMTTVSGLEFGDAWRNRKKSSMFGVEVNFISMDDLITNKSATGRRADLEQLKQLKKKSGGAI